MVVKSEKWVQHLVQGVYLCGQFTKPVYVDLHPHTNATMVQLFPWTPAYFGMKNATALTDNILEIGTFLKEIALDTPSITTASYAGILKQLTLAFAPLAAQSVAAKMIEEASRIILSAKGDIKIASVAETMKCSIRHLQKLFKTHIGLTPKELAAIIQLRESIDDIAYHTDSPLALSRVALLHKFYDQAHFSNKFQLLLGKSPKHFRSADYFLSLKK